MRRQNKMVLRKALAYSKKKVRPYTRKSKVKSRSYIKTIPQQKIVKFRMGDVKGYETGKLKNVIKLVAGEGILIRDNALEASRQYIHKALQEEIPGQYYLEIKVFPHHILRENKVLTGASKGERVNTGMQLSFGSVMGRAAIVKPNQTIFLVAVFHEKLRELAVKALEKIKAKIPCHARIVIEKRE
jgi:large subunit ribosomal protein L10e